MRSLVLILLLFGSISAVHMLAPVDTEIKEGDVVYIGEIGPGQTIPLVIEEKVTTGGKFGIGGDYNLVIFEQVPVRWRGERSKLYGHPLQASLTADSNAQEGEYTAKVVVIDENNADGLGNVSFFVKVNITYDVMDMDVHPTFVRTGPGQPARFEITIKNKGATGDAFEVSATGEKRWEFKRTVFVPAKSSKTIVYEIVGNEEEVYRSKIAVVSRASQIIHEEKNVVVDVRSDIIGDMKATNNGVIIFPIYESLVYAFFGLISNIF
ncbi:MAG: hypothetical protein QW171_03250 [Candidatus Bilamarchaeaceae archaeon]